MTSKAMTMALMGAIKILQDAKCTLVETVNPFNSGHLGDRTTYFGASEMASACQAKTYYERVYGKGEKTLPQMIIIAIGHLAESLMALMFRAIGKLQGREVALYHPVYKHLRATNDFLWIIFGGKGAKVYELKSSSDCPEQPHTSWENQVIIQQGFVLENYPDVDPAQLVGKIICLSRSTGEIQEYLVPFDRGRYEALIDKALVTWKAIQAALKGEPHEIPEASPNGLCGYCHHRDKCFVGTPKGDALPEDLAAAAIRYAELAEVEATAKRTKTQLKALLTGYGGTRFKGLAGGTHQVSIYQKKGKTNTDILGIKKELSEVYGLPPEEVESIWSRHQTESKPSTVLEVSQLKVSLPEQGGAA